MSRKNVHILSMVTIILAIALGFLGYRTLRNRNINELEKVSLRLKWLDQAQFAGYYLAKSQGLYEIKGLEVEINPGGPDISPIQMVTIGVNDFGITGADQIILARGKGVPLVALAVIYKDSPVTIMSLKEKGIEFPKDLEGKKVAVVYGRDEELIYRALLVKEGVDNEKIEEVPSMASPTEILTQVDARVGYELNGGILLPLEGHEINMVKPRDYGIQFYADTVFTTEEMIKENPELVRNFVQATIEGWEMALVNSELAIDEVMQVNNTLNQEHQEKFLEGSVSMIAGRGEIGYFQKEVLESMQEMLLSQGILENSIELDKAFTNEFLR